MSSDARQRHAHVESAATATSSKSPTVLISLTEVERRTSKSRWWIRNEIIAGRFPKPVSIGQRTVFVEEEIEAWIRALLVSRREVA